MFEFAHVWACIYLHKFVPMLSLVYNLSRNLSIFTCLNMFHSHVPFICFPYIPVYFHRLSRVIHQHTFSRLAGAQFIDCMACLTSQTFLFCFSHSIAFLPVFQCLSLHMFKLVYIFTTFLLGFHPFTIFPSQCAPTWLSRAIHQHSFSRLAGAQFPYYITCLTSQSSAGLSTSLSNLSHPAQHPLFIYNTRNIL